ncbi:hypothetical protein KGY14_10275 [Ameyamaea chiangmaiensis]|uniref:Uncharacterized protein n=1 Tax=Ameyamaea chiangmaiensis TaxID=442969 RepID=A0A850PEC8_9PROT|nr:hypothetical protein [Ameyamaea chiangmaiensis]MBS4075578.1 hypothetical protein [Ameyamaea chiangmaiensis]NVN40292.1 hypothetical protein [Ameyamaea chiangmaiensis]
MHDFTITLYALEGDGVSVRADIFATKVQKTVAALNRADKASNDGKKTAVLVVESLEYASASISFRERVSGSAAIRSSGAALLIAAISSINTNPENISPIYKSFLPYAQSLVTGLDKKFSHAVISGKSGEKIRVDNFFSSQVEIALRSNQMKESMYFSGIEDGAFDGQIKVLDDRGEMPRGKIILTAGGQEIDCIFKKDMIENIRVSQRVSVEGSAYYSSTSLLPQRVFVRSITKIDNNADLSRWRSAFKFDDSEDSWGGN